MGLCRVVDRKMAETTFSHRYLLVPFPGHRDNQEAGILAERVPADASYTATNACGNDMTPFYSPGIPGHPACHIRACKYPVLGIFEERRAMIPRERLLTAGA